MQEMLRKPKESKRRGPPPPLPTCPTLVFLTFSYSFLGCHPNNLSFHPGRGLALMWKSSGGFRMFPAPFQKVSLALFSSHCCDDAATWQVAKFATVNDGIAAHPCKMSRVVIWSL